MTDEEIQTTYCRRIQKDVYAEDIRDITREKIFVICKYYDSSCSEINKFPCIKDSAKNRKCLVELLIKRESSKLKLVK